MASIFPSNLSFQDAYNSQPVQHQEFNPYTDNGGSILGISGEDYILLAGDTRSTQGYSINTRMAPKIFRIGGNGADGAGANLILGVVGFGADGASLKERLDTIVKIYRFEHGTEMSVHACAQRLSHLLYSRRFFPLYVHALLGGLDENGKGALYTYDPVGSYEREQCRAAGAAASLMMPFLDNQVLKKNQCVPGLMKDYLPEAVPTMPQPLGRAKCLVEDAFSSAVERHIEVGDSLQTLIITKNGIEEIFTPLKKD